ncbi:hypothetical protein ACIGZJ_31245 [Kitasatospora sp. NPDC052868]|uniref:hypothetical protein n=1 Tax=Kitasatospora sp. NPDC052868 TaxID=3364060 RepID=UPI0037CC1EC2
MRVRTTEATQAYWNYQVHDLPSGYETDGEFAEHLWNVRAPVEIVDGEPPAPPEDPAQDEAPTDTDTNPGHDGDSPDADEPPVDATIETLINWVGGDPGRARTALTAEQAKDAPRATAVKRLAAIVETAEDDDQTPDATEAEAETA